MKNLIIVLAVFIISALGCKMTGTDSTNPDTGSKNTNSKEQPAKASNAQEELLNAFKKFREVPFATTKSVRTGDKTETITEQYSSVNSSFSRKSDDEEASQIIIIGSETFSKMNIHWEWRKESEAKTTASEGFFATHQFLEKHIPDFDIKSKGEEGANGKTAMVYDLTLSKLQPEVPSLIRIWVGKDSGLPLKIFKEFGKDKNLTETIDFESKVNIERPTVGKK